MTARDIKYNLHQAYFNLLNGKIVIPVSAWPDPVPAVADNFPFVVSVSIDGGFVADEQYVNDVIDSLQSADLICPMAAGDEGKLYYKDKDYIVPVYDSVPNQATYPYIRLGDWTEVDFSDKTAYGAELTFELQIVDRYDGSLAPRGLLYLVLDGVKSIIRDRNAPFDIDGWNVITSVVDGEDDSREMNQSKTYLLHNIRFRHLAEQVDNNQLTYQGNSINYQDQPLIYGT